MPAAKSKPFELRPLAGTVVADGCFVAAGPQPWLEIRPVAAFRKGAAIEIGYAAGLSDRMTRPILQFRARDGRVWNALMPAPSEGAAFWRGRVPPETVEVRVCPTDTPGPFEFTIESIRILSPREMMRLRVANPRRGLFATGARMVRLRDEADLNLRFVLERAETQNFEAWRTRRRRSAVTARSMADLVTIVISAASDAATLARSCAALLAQGHASWRLALRDPSGQALDWARRHDDPRIFGATSIEPGAIADGAFVMCLRAGDRLTPHALDAFLAAFARRPEREIVYSDDARFGPASVMAEPHFKPDWSPTRQAWAPYVGRAAMIRAAFARPLLERVFPTPQALVDTALAAADAAAIGHVARVLVETADGAEIAPRENRRAAPARTAATKITIIIPTRDKIRLLARCLDTLFARTHNQTYDVLVIDNGSVEAATLSRLEKYRREQPRFDVAVNPMPFNFSALCNFGAARAKGDTLVFLNNDTVVLQPRWLEHMLEFAAKPDVGTVGCKLLYPTGRVQHAGVVLGLGGVAGHFGEGLGRRARGWLGGSLAPHEASAVTAACMMVERAKFEAVGGFDAENLPVDLNDVDLCLRLNARGWRTICDCRVMLAHYQSASRGGNTLRLQKVYRAEREYFTRTWSAAIRNDPFFNPNLSLYDREPRLG